MARPYATSPMPAQPYFSGSVAPSRPSSRDLGDDLRRERRRLVVVLDEREEVLLDPVAHRLADGDLFFGQQIVEAQEVDTVEDGHDASGCAADRTGRNASSGEEGGVPMVGDGGVRSDPRNLAGIGAVGTGVACRLRGPYAARTHPPPEVHVSEAPSHPSATPDKKDAPRQAKFLVARFEKWFLPRIAAACRAGCCPTT